MSDRSHVSEVVGFTVHCDRYRCEAWFPVTANRGKAERWAADHDRDHRCTRCDGSGEIPGHDVCPDCFGVGEYPNVPGLVRGADLSPEGTR